jgi:hypothetical protein
MFLLIEISAFVKPRPADPGGREEVMMLSERRESRREPIHAEAHLQHSAASAQIYNMSDRGLGLRISDTLGRSLAPEEVILLSSAGKNSVPCSVEAKLKWQKKGSESILVGFELKSLQTGACRDMFRALAEGRLDEGEEEVY